jgi:drug/metabolite transporter (DMT)-like permease
LNKRPLVFICLSAILFGVSPPLAKILVRDTPPVALAGLLYLGAFLGLSIYSLGRKILSNSHRSERALLTKGDLPWLCGAIISGGIIAPISLMFGLRHVSGFAASLLLNLEGVSTAVIAVFLFRESAGNRLWWAMACMTAAGFFLTWEPIQGTFNLAGPVLICIAMVSWGLDNNLTRYISARDPIQIALIKGLVSGATSLLLAYVLGMGIPWNVNIILALLLGCFSYGISLVFFIKALEGLGSFRTGVFFSLAPFIGAVISLILLQEWIGWVMLPATGLMVVGLWLMIEEKHSHLHVHEEMMHTHLHNHDDIHHYHEHTGALIEPHSHEHVHHEEAHAHAHWPDTHHRHAHDS